MNLDSVTLLLSIAVELARITNAAPLVITGLVMMMSMRMLQLYNPRKVARALIGERTGR